jgi:arylsulfatase
MSRLPGLHRRLTAALLGTIALLPGLATAQDPAESFTGKIGLTRATSTPAFPAQAQAPRAPPTSCWC